MLFDNFGTFLKSGNSGAAAGFRVDGFTHARLKI
jgi:hypothetical protein